MIFDSKYSSCRIDQRTVVSKEKGNEHILHNHSGYVVYQYRVDGEIMKDSLKERCDFIVEAQKDSDQRAYMIELKGSDLNKALGQLIKTIEWYKKNLQGYKILPRVVIHRTPTHDIQGAEYRSFKKKYPELMVKNKKMEERI